MEHLTDEQLVERVRQGDAEAYRYLVDRHKSYVYTLIFRMVNQRETAEDLSQDVFLKLFRSLSHFRGESKFTTWLYRMTVNLVTDYLRAQRRRPVVPLLDRLKTWLVDRRTEPEEQAIRHEESDTVHRMLAELPEKYRLVIYLYHFKQLSYQEIADVTDLPLKTIETRLYRGKAMLKQKWLEVYPDARTNTEAAESTAATRASR
ncbi:RNA polymerase sigma factor [Paenibacillus lutrae]|uniref:Sigma-70 family RNA polymerase sigma factor n=1 Tax=Paenibacillus lutrae TaxID=2078573 RepID=A0A7X3FLN7_9BACL|nr:sigma-70 family RNA polymerase sigma factor [Paenibacillus lutrae]MVP02006.1 sigma-70 family RNA polymerase sigma factor [Paenibacillus lutrae]